MRLPKLAAAYTIVRWVFLVISAFLLAGVAEPLMMMARLRLYHNRFVELSSSRAKLENLAKYDYPGKYYWEPQTAIGWQWPLQNSSGAWQVLRIDKPHCFEIHYRLPGVGVSSVSPQVKEFPSHNSIAFVYIYVNRNCQYPLADLHRILSWPKIKHLQFVGRDRLDGPAFERHAPNDHVIIINDIQPTKLIELRKRVTKWYQQFQSAGGKLTPEQWAAFESDVDNIKH